MWTWSFSDIEFFPPFPATKTELSTHITYLDTTGRPVITFYYKNLTDRHSGIIYVSVLKALLSYSVIVDFCVMDLGGVQSALFGTPQETHCSCHSARGIICTRICLEAC